MTRMFASILAFAFLALWPGAAPAYLPPGFVGIAPQNYGTAKDYRLIREAGVRSVRLPLNWSEVEPENPAIAERHWEAYDEEAKLAAEQGLRVFPFVAGSPEWVAPARGDLPVARAWQRRAWTSFLRQAVARYGSDGAFWREHPALPYLPMRQWEIWNEENIVTFATDPDPKRFAELIRISGRVIHREEPGARVIFGGLFGRPLQVPPNVASGDFLARFYAAGHVKPFFDGVGLHPYVADAKAMAGQLANLRRIMRGHGDRRTPLYVTELGWGSADGPTRWQRGLFGQAQQLTKALRILSANRLRWGVAGAWWYTWTDEGGSCVFCRSAGLLNGKREAKPAWYRFVEWTGGNAEAVRPAQSAE
jgi:polysaccharide biosynthesis protein PslG